MDPGVAEAQSSDALCRRCAAGWVMSVKTRVADDGVVADRLGVEESPVGGEADLPQGGQVAQPFADPEVAGVVDGGLGAKGSSFLVILLDAGVLVLDVQADGVTPWVNTRVRNRLWVRWRRPVKMRRSKIKETRSGRPTSRFSRMTVSKNTRPEAGRSSIWVRENSALQDGHVVAVAGPPVAGGEGMREPSQPLAGQSIDTGRVEAVTDALQTGRVRHTQRTRCRAPRSRCRPWRPGVWPTRCR